MGKLEGDLWGKAQDPLSFPRTGLHDQFSTHQYMYHPFTHKSMKAQPHPHPPNHTQVYLLSQFFNRLVGQNHFLKRVECKSGRAPAPKIDCQLLHAPQLVRLWKQVDGDECDMGGGNCSAYLFMCGAPTKKKLKVWRQQHCSLTLAQKCKRTSWGFFQVRSCCSKALWLWTMLQIVT